MAVKDLLPSQILNPNLEFHNPSIANQPQLIPHSPFPPAMKYFMVYALS